MMQKDIRILFPFILLCLVFLSCCNKDKPDPIASCYPSEIETIIVSSCAIEGCHISPDAPENLDLSTWDKLFEGSDFGAVMIPYLADWSHVYQHLNTYAELGIQATPIMPPSPDSVLTRSEVTTLRDWINSGAPNCEGMIKWRDKEDSGLNKLFSLCAGSDLVAVADLDQNLVMRFFEVGNKPDQIESPHFIKLSPDNAFAYITLIEGGFVEKFRTDTYEKVGRIEVGPDPALIELSPDGEIAMITHFNSNPGSPKLTMLNTSDMTIIEQAIGSSDLLSNPHGMASTSDFSTIYVVASQGNYYSKISISSNGFLGEEKVLLGDDVFPAVAQQSSDFGPYHCIISPDEQYLFISCNHTNEVRVFDLNTDMLVKRIPVGEFPRLMTYDPLDDRLFVACANEENFTEQGSVRGCVSVIDVETLSFEQNIYRLGHRPHGLDIDEVKRVLFVSSENVGGTDPPHHPTTGSVGPPGKYNVVDLKTLAVIKDMETEVAVFPNALVVSQ